MNEPDDPLLVGARQLLFAENVRDFNRLRERYPNLRLVLRGENLAGLNLAGIDLHGALLERVCLLDCALAEACFDGATLLGCQARRGDFRGASFVGARIDSYRPPAGAEAGDMRQKTVFAEADLARADLSRARLSGVDLAGADLSEAILAGTALENVDLQDTVLRNAEAPHLLLRGNTAYLARTWGTAENPGPKPGEGPLLEGCNAFGVRLANSTDPTAIIRPDWRPDGTRNDDPRQTEKARKAETRNDEGQEKRPMSNGETRQGRVEQFKNRAAEVGQRAAETAKVEIPEAARRAGATLFVRTTRAGIIQAYASFQGMDEDQKRHLAALADTDVGDMIVRLTLSAGIAIFPVPEAAKPYADVIEKELRVSGMASGGVALGEYVAKTIGGPLMQAIEVMRNYTPEAAVRDHGQMSLLTPAAAAFDPLRGHDAAVGVQAQPRTEG